jgi:hypothetical protein
MGKYHSDVKGFLYGLQKYAGQLRALSVLRAILGQSKFCRLFALREMDYEKV